MTAAQRWALIRSRVFWLQLPLPFVVVLSRACTTEDRDTRCLKHLKG